jgi:hypothetical protein
MALGSVTWTPDGVVAGLGAVPGLAVFPHADATAWVRQADWFPTAAAAGIGILGLGERTGILSGPAGTPRNGWRVIGEGEVRWLAPGASDPLVLRDGDLLELPG